MPPNTTAPLNRWLFTARCVWMCVCPCAVIGLSFGRVCGGEPIRTLVVFGDSVSDTGNVHRLSEGRLAPPPYFEGRFSNGPVWVEYLADALHVPRPTPSLRGGTNYAYSGAQTVDGDNDTTMHISVPGMQRQVTDYLSDHQPRGDELFVVYGGYNDINVGKQQEMAPVVANLGTCVRRLHQAGGRHFLLADLFPIYDATGPVRAEFNRLWADEVRQLQHELQADIRYFDWSGLSQRIYTCPQLLGIEQFFPPALDARKGTLRSDPDTTFIWDEDGWHATTRVHRIYGQAAAELWMPVKSWRLELLADQGLPQVTWQGSTAACHTQGLTISERYYLVSGRWESDPPRPIVVQFHRDDLQQYRVIDLDSWSRNPSLVDSASRLDHPGGMCRVGDQLWIPLSSSQRAGPTVILSLVDLDTESIDPSVREVTRVSDHIGALCYVGSTRKLYGANWDTLRIHQWDVQPDGRLAQHTVVDRSDMFRDLPEWQLAVQDWHHMDADLVADLKSPHLRAPASSWVLAGGIDKSPAVADRDRGVIDLLDFAQQRRLARWTVPMSANSQFSPTREGMATWRGELYLLPADLNRSARLLKYSWIDDSSP